LTGVLGVLPAESLTETSTNAASFSDSNVNRPGQVIEILTYDSAHPRASPGSSSPRAIAESRLQMRIAWENCKNQVVTDSSLPNRIAVQMIESHADLLKCVHQSDDIVALEANVALRASVRVACDV
jgi:hypothetical protein